MSPLVWLILAGAGFLAGSVIYGNARRQAIDAECRADPVCLDMRAQFESELVDHPVRSDTGRLFAFGFQCQDDCTQHMTGWRWASSRKIEHPWQCAGDSEPYLQGCHAYLIR